MHQIFALEKLFQVIWTICKLDQNVGQERSKGHKTFELAKIWKLLICHEPVCTKSVQWSNYGPKWVYNIYSDSFGSPMFKDYPMGKNINKLSWRNFEYLRQMPFWARGNQNGHYFPTNNPTDMNYDSNYCVLKTLFIHCMEYAKLGQELRHQRWKHHEISSL